MVDTVLVNPFDLAYDKLVDICRRSEAIKYALGNEKKFVSENERDGIRDWEAVITEDFLPDIRLNHSTVGGNLNMASNAAQIDREYNFLIRTEKKELSRSIHRVEWALLCALVDANYNVELRALEWAGQTFVKNIALTSFASGDMDTERTGLVGWASVCTIRMAMIFPQSSMKQFARGDVVTTPTKV